MFSSVFSSILLTFAVIQPLFSTTTQTTEVADPDTSFAYQSSLDASGVVTTDPTLSYEVMVEQPQEDVEAEMEEIRQAEAEKARQEELKRIEFERNQAELRRIAAAEAARKAAEEEKAKHEAAARQAAARRVIKPTPVNYTIPGNVDYETLIRERCARLGCEGSFVIAIMYCESGGRADAVNRSSGASGLFQQMPQFWNGRAAAAGVPGASVFDPYAQIIVATHMISRGMAHHWTDHGCPR